MKAAAATRIRPDGASGGYYSMFQYTVLTMQINSFLCPSDQDPGSSGTYAMATGTKLVGACNYPSNVGLNRRINGVTFGGNPSGGNWQENGPGYLASTWDGIGVRVITHQLVHRRDEQYGHLQRVGQGARHRLARQERAGHGVLLPR